jgi:hypothetical protein
MCVYKTENNTSKTLPVKQKKYYEHPLKELIKWPLFFFSRIQFQKKNNVFFLFYFKTFIIY